MPVRTTSVTLSLLLLAAFHNLFYPTSASPSPVIIIGAGVAGARVAYELSKQSIPFLVVEATDRVGGRLRKQLLGGRRTGLEVELGANWIQGYRQGDVLSDFVTAHVNLSGVPVDYDDSYFVEDGALVPDAVANPVWDRFYEAIHKLYRLRNRARDNRSGMLFDMSVKAGLLMAAGWEANSPIEKAAMRFSIDYEYAMPGSQISIHELSPIYAPNAPDSEDLFIKDPRGFRAVVDELLHMAGVDNVKRTGPKLLLNAPVRTIRYSETGASIQLRDGRVFSGSAVVSTVSLGVLQESLFRNPKESSRLIFRPPLPFEKRLAISKYEFADYTKVFIQFKRPIFKPNDPLHLLPIECSEGGFVLLQNLNKKGYYAGSNAVLITAVEAFARGLSCLVAEERERKVLGEALKYVSNAVGRKVERDEVRAFLVPEFRRNEFFKGTYSTRTPGMTDEDLEAFNKPIGALFFAGEAHESRFNGYVQGAFMSGGVTAKDVIEFLKQ